MKKILDKIEEEIDEHAGSMLTTFHLGIALKVFEDRLWGLDNDSAQRCNDLQHKLLKD